MSLLNFTEFQWRAMTEAINQIKRAPRLLQDVIFKNRVTRPSEYIDVDVVVGGKKIVPFVSPIEGGTVVEKMGQEMRSIRAPRLRPKKPFTATELLSSRGIGQGFYATSGGDITSARQLRLARELEDLKNRLDMTIEWMCAQALTGTLAVTQDNLAFSVDYQVPSAHKDTLTGENVWTHANSNPANNIQTWADLMINAIGIAPDVLVMGTAAASSFLAHAKVKDLINRTLAYGSNEFSWKASSNYLGNLMGIDCYRYGGQYEDSSGSATNLIGTDKVVLAATQARFSIEFGLILDLEAEAQVMAEYFSKSWVERDPSVMWLLAESRPMPVPWQPEAIVYMDVQ